MSVSLRRLAAKILVASALLACSSSRADFELPGPDGRRILLKDNGTWRYVDSVDGNPSNVAQGEAILRLERKADRGNGCRFTVQLANNLPYEIKNLIPYYSAYRANGIVYDTVSASSGFILLKPGDKQIREIEFTGISCQDIVRVQVIGGDRCDMGDLDKFSLEKGRCLGRVRVVESDLVRFDK